MKTILIPLTLISCSVLALGACASADQPASSPSTSPAPSVAAGAPSSVEHETAQPRLVVTYADGVEVFDLNDGEASPVATLPLDSPARPTVGSDGRHVFLTDGENGTTAVLDSGSYAQGHGEHFHFYTRTPAFRPDIITGPTPVHVVGHDGVVAISHDGDGSFHVFDELGLTAGGIQVSITETGAPQHGVAVPIAGGLLYTALLEGDEGPLPDTILQTDDAGAVVATYADACPGLHGEAHLGDLVIFGCANGVTVIDPAAHTSTLIPNPADAGELRIGSLYADADSLVGNWGTAGFTLIDVAAGTITPVTVDGGVVTTARGTEGEILVLTTDGIIHVYDESGASVGQVAALDAFPMPEGHGAVRPSLAIADDTIIVSDPVQSRLVLVDASTWTVEGAIALESVPTAVVATGLDPHGHADHDH